MSVRKHLHDAIQETVHVEQKGAEDHYEDADELDGAVLVGWIVIAEWMAPDGRRWLSRAAGSASGEDAPEWQRDGYLHNALHRGGWDGDDEGDW